MCFDKDGDPAAIPQFARYNLLMLEEPNYDMAYIWFSIAAALGLTVSAAKVRGHRAMSALRDILGDAHV